MDHSDARGVGRVIQEREREDRVDRIEARHEQNGTDQVEVQVNQGCAARVLARADGGQQRRHTGTDVLAHDDRQRRTILHSARHAQRLQNTDRRGGGLDHSCQQETRDHAQDRIGEHQQNVREFRHVGQRLNRRAHHVHAVHQHGEADQDLADVVLLLALGEHDEGHAAKRHDGREGRGLEQLNKEVAALNACQRQNPAGDRGTDIRTHNHAGRLRQLHDAGVDEANDHDRRR